MKRVRSVALAGAALLAGVAAGTGTAAPTEPGLTHVAAANTKSPGYAPPDALAPELVKFVVAQGSTRLENGTAAVPYYGYDGNGPMLPLPGAPTAEATKTEPDKNTYLVLKGQRGADSSYDYGTHFVFQGHEGGSPGYITRVNLDADVAHRVTLLATTDTSGANLPTFDGSTWDPFAQRLLFSAERGPNGGLWQATPDVPSAVQDISGAVGRGGYEGIQNDSDGNLVIVEDVGGPADATGAKKPNSFIYRFAPVDRRELTKGKLQVLQLASLLNPGQPFAADTFSADQKDLHTYGRVFPTTWVTIHDTAVDGTTPFDANALAKAKGATPFKRPENGQFRPGTGFREFYFDETGDTNANSAANADFGGWGSVFRLSQGSPSADRGVLTMLYKGDQAHAGFDNMTFFSRDDLAVVEDAGDTLHTQRNALDSGFVFDVGHNYADGSQPLRFLAQGRDPSATIDSAIHDITPPVPFKNDGDNEITGIHTSDGNPGPEGLLGAQVPARPFDPSSPWRTFYTGQHGDNVTWRIVSLRPGSTPTPTTVANQNPACSILESQLAETGSPGGRQAIEVALGKLGCLA